MDDDDDDDDRKAKLVQHIEYYGNTASVSI